VKPQGDNCAIDNPEIECQGGFFRYSDRPGGTAKTRLSMSMTALFEGLDVVLVDYQDYH